MTTTQRLNKLESLLKNLNAPVVEHFNPGLPKEVIIDFLRSHNIRAIPSLINIYEWHNGVKTVYGFLDGIVELYPFGKLFNLEEMISMRSIFYDWAADDFEDLDNYIPFMGSGESDMFLLDLTTGEVLAYQPMIQIVGELSFRSIDSMLDCLIECHEEGVFTVDPQQGLDTDYHAYRAIQEAHLER